LTTSDSNRARDCQQASISGEAPGSSCSDPAGMMISRPLRVASGSGHPQFRQNEVEKLRAVERSKRGHLVLTIATSGTRAARRMRLLNTHYQLPCDIENDGSS
jgi:hypothetical protein